VLLGLLSFYAVCSIGAVANVGIADFLFVKDYDWWVSGICGILVGAVWNYATSALFTWRSEGAAWFAGPAARLPVRCGYGCSAIEPEQSSMRSGRAPIGLRRTYTRADIVDKLSIQARHRGNGVIISVIGGLDHVLPTTPPALSGGCVGAANQARKNKKRT
jgi:hypothetical protein